jgi:carbon-monoxide dehydrogenase medium subunit
MCGVAAVVSRTDGRASARVALVGVGDGPVRVDVSEAVADGGVDTGAVAGLVDAAIEPADDIHATADYRRHLAHVLVGRALHEAGDRAA